MGKQTDDVYTAVTRWNTGWAKRMSGRSVNGLAFDEVAAIYDRARPGYPDALFDDVMQIATLGPASRVLEIGPGTGQATRSLAKRGLSIVSLEPGATLARIAQANLMAFPRVRIVKTSFEAWTIEPHAFDLVAAAFTRVRTSPRPCVVSASKTL